MALHDRQTMQNAGALIEHAVGSAELVSLPKRLVTFTAAARDIETLIPRARQGMGGGVTNAVVCWVVLHNLDEIWGVARRDRYTAGDTAVEGCLALPMLNDEEADRPRAGQLDATDPPLDLLTRQHEKPASIYVWGVHAGGIIVGGVPLAFEKIWTRLYSNAPILARAARAERHRTLESVGFNRGAILRGRTAPHCHVYPRGKSVKEMRAAHDTHLGTDDHDDDDISLTIARSIEDLMRVGSIRRASFVSRQDRPYEEAFDGNDFSAGDFPSYVGDEPVGCLRIRYFADFANLERLAVCHEFRKRQIGTKLTHTGVKLCRMSGYRRICGGARKAGGTARDFLAGMHNESRESEANSRDKRDQFSILCKCSRASDPGSSGPSTGVHSVSAPFSDSRSRRALKKLPGSGCLFTPPWTASGILSHDRSISLL
jgi:Acetyltransferase (GNAT) family